MSLDLHKAIERSVDSVAKIYAVVIGLALSESVKTLIVRNADGSLDFSGGKFTAGLPAFIAFVVTVVPFWHGMNRHLDRSYLEKVGTVVQGALLLDFAVFFLEATFLFSSGYSLRAGLITFYCLGLVLLMDMLWGFVSHQIHSQGEKSHVLRWASVNVGFGTGAVLVVAFPFEYKSWVLALIAILRSIIDYYVCWDFYFPAERRNEKSVEQTTLSD